MQIRFHLPDAEFFVVKQAGCQRRIRAAFVYGFTEVIELPCSARRDDRDRHRVADGARQLELVLNKEMFKSSSTSSVIQNF